MGLRDTDDGFRSYGLLTRKKMLYHDADRTADCLAGCRSGMIHDVKLDEFRLSTSKDYTVFFADNSHSIDFLIVSRKSSETQVLSGVVVYYVDCEILDYQTNSGRVWLNRAIPEGQKLSDVAKRAEAEFNSLNFSRAKGGLFVYNSEIMKPFSNIDPKTVDGTRTLGDILRCIEHTNFRDVF
jgi:hypothetical protein